MPLFTKTPLVLVQGRTGWTQSAGAGIRAVWLLKKTVKTDLKEIKLDRTEPFVLSLSSTKGENKGKSDFVG